MWSECLLTVSTGLLAAGAYLIISTVIKARQALSRYKSRSAGLPILDGANPLKANHGVEFHLGRNVSNKLAKWHEQHGNTFGFLYGTRPCASTIDLDLIHSIINNGQHINRMPFNTALPEMEYDTIFYAEGEQWARMRRAFGPPLRKFKMPNLVGQIEESLANMVRSIEKKIDKSEKSRAKIVLDDLAHRFSLDIVYRCLYKQEKIIDYETERCQVVDVVDEALRSPIEKSLPMKLCLVFPFVRYLLDPLVKNFTQMGEWQLTIIDFIREQTKLALKARQYLKKRSVSGKEVADKDDFKFDDGSEFKRGIVDFIIDQYLDGKLTRTEYFHTSFFLFGAADKTVCDAIIQILYQLSINQQLQDKLRASIMESGLNSEYMIWVINEALRLHPPATIGCSRTISHDIKLAEGHILPAGTYVHTPLYVIHRLRKFWGEDAHEFRPERWADTSQFHPMQFLPFGAGRRGCPGKELALFEMKQLLVSLLAKFKFCGEKKLDTCLFDSPYTLYTIPNSLTYVTIQYL